MEGTLTLTLWLVVVHASLVVDSSPVKQALFDKCQKGAGIFQGSALSTLTVQEARCFHACLTKAGCQSVNICPSSLAPDLVQCSLMSDFSPWHCRDLDTSTPGNQQCYHAEKKTYCHNGGRVQADNSCQCDLCFKGTNCDQHVRDCQEAAEQLPLGGYPHAAMCRVQPRSSPSPFTVRCPFNGNTDTVLLLRVQDPDGSGQLDWPNQPWSRFKGPIGSWGIYNFFVGLENMRHFLNQGLYLLNQYNSYFDPKPSPPIQAPSFRNVTLRDEAGRYALSYSLFTNSNPNVTEVLESFRGAGYLHPFCTRDNDCGTCAQDKGPGWYYVQGGGCHGNSPFAIRAEWPYEGYGQLIIGQTEYPFQRVGNFYDP